MYCVQLDAFVAPTNNQSAPRLDAPRPLGRHARPDTWSFLGAQGIPHLTVPAGFTTDVWDRIRDPSVDPATLHDLSPADEDSERRRRAETRPDEGCERSAIPFHDVGPLPASSLACRQIILKHSGCLLSFVSNTFGPRADIKKPVRVRQTGWRSKRAWRCLSVWTSLGGRSRNQSC